MKVLDLYSGAGGLGFGFELTDAFEVVCGVDIYEPANNSFYQNHKCAKNVRETFGGKFDLGLKENRELLSSAFSDVDIVVGGPPCQGFSVAGQRLDDFMHDERNSHVFNFLDIVERIRPRAFVMENVRGIKTTGQKKKNTVVDELIERYKQIGYTIQWKVLNAEDFFVPQKRRRFFLVGIRADLATFSFPVAQCGEQSSLFGKQYAFTTVGEALEDLPDPLEVNPQPYTKPALNWFQKFLRDGSETLNAHTPTKHKPDFIERLKAQKIGTKLYPNWNHSWVKLDPNSIAPTIKENHRAPGVHYRRPMCISPRECARLQAMPDRFILSGTKSQNLVLVGNAVPPLLSAAIATELAKSFKLNNINEFGVMKYLKAEDVDQITTQKQAVNQ